MNHRRILSITGVGCSCGWGEVTDERTLKFSEHLAWINWIEAPLMTSVAAQVHELMCLQHLEFDDFVERSGWSVRRCEEFLSGHYDPNLRELATAGLAVGRRFDLKLYDKSGYPLFEEDDEAMDDWLDEAARWSSSWTIT